MACVRLSKGSPCSYDNVEQVMIAGELLVRADDIPLEYLDQIARVVVQQVG